MSKLSSLNSYSDAHQADKKIIQKEFIKSAASPDIKPVLKYSDSLVFEKQKERFEKALSLDNAIDLRPDHSLLTIMGIGRHEPSLHILENPFRIGKNNTLNHSEKMNGLPLADSIRALIGNLSMKEDTLVGVNAIDGSRLQSVVQPNGFTQSYISVNESNQENFISKVNLVQSMVAEIVPKVSGILDKQAVIIRLSGEGATGLEIQISRQGNELSMVLKTTNVDVFKKVINSQQDLQYSLESKLPNITVKIDMDLTDQSDRESKGYYVLPDEDET